MFDKIFPKKVRQRNYVHQFSLFSNSEHHEQYEQLVDKGYIVLKLLDSSEIEQLNLSLSIFLKDRKIEKIFYTSGRDEAFVRDLAKKLTWPVVESKIFQLIDSTRYDSNGCTFLLKPYGLESSLSPHQDSSLIDETKFAAFYGWIALQDTTIENGCMHAIPGSHLWGNHFRSLDVPWIFEKYTDLLLEYSQPIEMKAGEILLFDTALIHGSYPNKTNNLRAAVNLFFKPKNASMTHYARFNDTPSGKIESYKIDNDFFFKEDYRSRPKDAEKYPFLGYVDQVELKLSEKKIRKMCQSKR